MENCSYPATFNKICDHDEYSYSLLPNHLPEAVECRRQGALGADVGPWLLETINVVGIDVVDGLFLPRIWHKTHPAVII